MNEIQEQDPGIFLGTPYTIKGREKYILPSVEQTHGLLVGACVFSKFDARTFTFS